MNLVNKALLYFIIPNGSIYHCRGVYIILYDTLKLRVQQRTLFFIINFFCSTLVTLVYDYASVTSVSLKILYINLLIILCILYINLLIILCILYINLGEVAEWSKATDCKSVSLPHVGSNPTFFTS